MTIHLVTFSDENMDRASQTCVRTAKTYGEVDSTWIYEPGALARFRAEPRLLNERGCGYWWWKPQILFDAMSEAIIRLPGGGYRDLIDGDTLIYADAGIEFINNVHYIVDRMDQDIFLFGNNWEHAHWCKRDVVNYVWSPLYALEHGSSQTGRPIIVEDGGISWSNFGKQAQASVIFFRVSDYSRKFVKEWLDWCLFEGGRLIDDSPSRTPNHPEFREHRHDQALLTTMAYRDGIKLHYWPAMYNDGAFTYEKLPEYAGDDYPTLFHHHRRRNHEWESNA